jgi:hypothetical protein
MMQRKTISLKELAQRAYANGYDDAMSCKDKTTPGEDVFCWRPMADPAQPGKASFGFRCSICGRFSMASTVEELDLCDCMESKSAAIPFLCPIDKKPCILAKCKAYRNGGECGLSS